MENFGNVKLWDVDDREGLLVHYELQTHLAVDVETELVRQDKKTSRLFLRKQKVFQSEPLTFSRFLAPLQFSK